MKFVYKHCTYDTDCLTADQFEEMKEAILFQKRKNDAIKKDIESDSIEKLLLKRSKTKGLK